MRGPTAIALCLALVACAADAPEQSDWERTQEAQSWQENRVTLPPFPKSANLVEFDVGAGSEFHFLVDAASLSVGSDGVVGNQRVAPPPPRAAHHR
jgi:hypothetical protein